METKRLEIRMTVMDDLNDIYEYVKIDDVMKYERENYPNKESLEQMLSILTKHKLLYSVRLKGKEQVIGHIFLGKTNPAINNEYNIGYIFHPAFQGKGYCTEASSLLVDYAFITLGANRVRAACNPKNIASWKVMEKIGLKHEGYFKKRFFLKRDSSGKPIYTDEVMYGLHYSDYQKRITK